MMGKKKASHKMPSSLPSPPRENIEEVYCNGKK